MELNPTKHAERVIQMHDLTTEERVASHRQKLAKAISSLGEKWIGHPARRLARAAHEKRDSAVAAGTAIMTLPILAADLLGWLV